MSDYVTQETFDKMREELQRMKSVDRPAASKAIAEAREKGDLKRMPNMMQLKRPKECWKLRLNNWKALSVMPRLLILAPCDTSKVTILTKVTITNLATKKTMVYQIVGEKEADLKLGKISASSPIGKGLLGKVVGEIAEVQAPNGILKFKIDNIGI
jgi:transcription elongation factor GreA